MKQLTSSYNKADVNSRYTLRETVDGNSEPVAVRKTPNSVLVVVEPSTSATIEYSLSSLDKISAGEGLWIEWPHGSVTETTADSVSSSVTALRLVSEGSCTWEISQ